MILVNHQPFAFIKSRTTDIFRYQSTQKLIPTTAEDIDIGIVVLNDFIHRKFLFDQNRSSQ
jgi:hypothetical protein